MEVKDRILQGAKERFFTVGIKSTTMDDIAQAVSVSKRTIYQHFPDKDALVEEVTLDILEKDKLMIEQFAIHSNNAVEHILMITLFVRKMMKQMQPSLVYDLQKYHNKAFCRYRDFKIKFMLNQLKDNIEQGKNEGYYRLELNTEIVSRLRLGCFEIVGNAELFPPRLFDYAEIHIEMFDHFVHGLFTIKGLEYFESLKDKHENYNQLTQSIISKFQKYV